MSLADDLKKLTDLVQQGFLTREEFEDQKQRLLSGATSTGTSGEHRPQLGAYRLQSKIGEGGMGTVYRGRHTQTGVSTRQGGDVAIKVMHPQYANREDFRARFDREAEVGLSLDHPNLVKVHDLVVDGQQLALVMEWVQGRPMSKMIGEETGPIPWERAWPLFEQLLSGVEHAHEAGVIHRDLKPENVMVTPEGAVKVLDFGIAKAADSGKTKTGTGLGTVDYMAPEQYLDAKRVDHRADIYALGMTLYEMLAGRLPWDESAAEFEVLTRKSQGDVPPPTAFYPSIPPQVVDAIMACISVEPADRPATIQALQERVSVLGEPAEPSTPAAPVTEATAPTPDPVQTPAPRQEPPVPSPDLTHTEPSSSNSKTAGFAVLGLGGGAMVVLVVLVMGVGAVLLVPALLGGVTYLGSSVSEEFAEVSSATDVSTTTPQPPDAARLVAHRGDSQKFLGCPAGTFAYDGWSGEYPLPIVQVNKTITVDALTNICETKPTLKCTVEPGLYNPWSNLSEADFKTVGAVHRFMTLKTVEFFDMTVPEGTEVIEQRYLAEGQCSLVINGQSTQGYCPSNGDREGSFKALPNASPDFVNQQYLGINCNEGHKGWIHITDAFMALPDVQEGQILGYGSVGPSALANGEPSPPDVWANRRANLSYDLGLSESEGPFWTIAISAGSSESGSRREVDELRQKGFPAHMAWLGGYGSAKNKALWFVYVGPYSYEDRMLVEDQLMEIKHQVNDESFAVTLGRTGQREQIK